MLLELKHLLFFLFQLIFEVSRSLDCKSTVQTVINAHKTTPPRFNQNTQSLSKSSICSSTYDLIHYNTPNNRGMEHLCEFCKISSLGRWSLKVFNLNNGPSKGIVCWFSERFLQEKSISLRTYDSHESSQTFWVLNKTTKYV